MPLTTIRNLQDVVVTAFNPVAGTPTGSRISVTSPVRGRIVEAGFTPASLVASAMTMQVATNLFGASSTASNFATIITSTLATFSSTTLFEGATASANPPANAPVNPGDVIQFAASGGNTSAIGANFYAIIREG